MEKLDITSKPTMADLGSIQQLGFVPRDLDAALSFWTKTVGVGPFFKLEHLPLLNTKYYGQPADLDVTAMIGYWGDMQIEIIRQHNDAPSPFTDWLHDGKEGLNHVRIDVPDMEEMRAMVAALGGVPLLEGECEGMGEFCYFDMKGAGPFIEAACLPKSVHKLFDLMRQESKAWNGSNPVRSVPDEWLLSALS